MAEHQIDHVTVSLSHWDGLQKELKKLREVVAAGDKLSFTCNYYSGRQYVIEYIGSDEAMKKLSDECNAMAERLEKQYATTAEIREDLQRKVNNLEATLKAIKKRSWWRRLFNLDPRKC